MIDECGSSFKMLKRLLNPVECNVKRDIEIIFFSRTEIALKWIFSVEKLLEINVKKTASSHYMFMPLQPLMSYFIFYAIDFIISNQYNSGIFILC